MVKRNFFPLVAITLAATPIVAFAQTPGLRPPQQPTPLQQRRLQVQQIESEAEAEIQKVLTGDQQTQFRRARLRGTGLLDSLDQVDNLSQDQQTKINTIVRNTSQRILNLTRRGRSNS